MDIYLSEVSDKDSDFTFPALPERIKTKFGTRYQNYDIIGLGTVKVPKGMEVDTISWDGVFYGKSKRREIMIREWTPPSECINTLLDWMKNGTVLRLLVTGTTINYDVTIGEFEPSEVGAYGNIEYSISFVINKELKIYTTSELDIADVVKDTVPRPEPEPSSNQNREVRTGDTLWEIAREFYSGSGSDWKKIYDANRDVIESTAKKYGKADSDNGRWIYPGTILTIP